MTTTSSLSASSVSTLTNNSTGTLSSLGVGSGLDVNGIISKLVALEQVPLTQLQSKASTIQTKISTFGQIQSLVATLNSTIANLADPTSWQAVTATSTNTSAVTATVAAGTAPTAVSIQVQSLAQAQSTYTTAVTPSGNAVGAGTLQIQLGTWSNSGSTFTAGSSSPVTINVSATDTVSTIATAINNAGAGVTATVVTDATGDHLLLNGTSTGAANGFQITAGSGSDTGLSNLVTGTTTTQQSQDAAATVNGIAVTSATNTFSSAISGVTFTALATTTTAVNITVAADTSTITTNIKSFVSAFNAVNEALTSVTAYDSTTKTAALLQGDAPTLNLKNSLLKAVSSQFGGTGTYKFLSDIGVQTQQGGDLKVDTTKLGTALSTNLSQVAKLFDATQDTDSVDGIGTGLENLTTSTLDSTKGFFASENTSLQAALNLNSQQQASVNARVSAVQAQLTKRYSALDAEMSKINSLNAYITQQITQWNKNTTIY